MSSNAEKFCLRWNDFESNISIAFREIREEKDFFDCTLSCGSRQIQAHKLILSACSPFFRSILKKNPHQHPLLYLKGVEFTDLQAVLNFMYHGEVNVAQEELNSFLAVAEDLKVKGLTQNSSGPDTPLAKQKPAPSLVTQETKPKVIRKDEPLRQPIQATAPPQPLHKPLYQEQQYDGDIQEVIPMVKTEPEQVSYTPSTQPAVTGLAMPSTEIASMQDNFGEDGYYGGYEEEEEQGYGGQYQQGFGGADQDTEVTDIGNYMSINYNDEGIKVYSCQFCGKAFKKSSHAKTHIKTVHAAAERKVNCGICAKTFKNNESLTTHFKIIHGLGKDQVY